MLEGTGSPTRRMAVCFCFVFAKLARWFDAASRHALQGCPWHLRLTELCLQGTYECVTLHSTEEGDEGGTSSQAGGTSCSTEQPSSSALVPTQVRVWRRRHTQFRQWFPHSLLFLLKYAIKQREAFVLTPPSHHLRKVKEKKVREWQQSTKKEERKKGRSE